MTNKEFLNVVENTLKNRGENYGGVENNFALIAEFWNCYLKNVRELNAVDVANMMILLKIARLCTAEEIYIDGYLDICGYAVCGGLLLENGDKNDC